jgi:hypothetical protein
MRIVVLILAILGAIACGFLGFAAYSGYSEAKNKPDWEKARALEDKLLEMDDAAIRQAAPGFEPSLLKDIVRVRKPAEMLMYSLMGAAGVGFIAGFLALFRFKWLACLLLLASAAAPTYFAFQIRDFIEKVLKTAGEMAQVDKAATDKAMALTGDTFFLVIAGAASPLALGGLLSLLIRSTPKRRPEEEGDEQLSEDEAPRPHARRIAPPVENQDRGQFFADEPPAQQAADNFFADESPPRAPAPAPTGPLVARFPCPKCGMSLKKTNPEAGKPIKCPKCATTFPIPAQAVEQARRGGM